MNANELADEIEQGKDGFRRDLIVTMLRQQQAEIDALKDIVERLTDAWSDGFKKYEYDADSHEQNKLRDDVFTILRKAQEK